jgi:hypothetical protein
VPFVPSWLKQDVLAEKVPFFVPNQSQFVYIAINRNYPPPDIVSGDQTPAEGATGL